MLDFMFFSSYTSAPSSDSVETDAQTISLFQLLNATST